MLMRKRIVRPVESAPDDAEPVSSDVLGGEVIATGATIHIPICTISRTESETLRDELNALLYCEAEQSDVDDLADEQ